MDFADEFEEWLREAFVAEVPQEVVAFCFNIYETPLALEGRFRLELVGTNEFDRESQDWACAEIWEPERRQIDIPLAFSGGEREECFEPIQSLILISLSRDDQNAKVLKSRKGVGVGFVDGDLMIVWQRAD